MEMDIESEEGIRSVVLRRGEGTGLGFSIMGGAGYDFPPVIYGIEKDSPAAISGMLEAGDVILSINEREVVKLSTKEVLKCLRLSGDIVHIKFKRDPQVVKNVRHFLAAPNYLEGGQDNHHHHAHSPAKSSTGGGGGGSGNKSKKGSQIPVYQPNQNHSPSHQQHYFPRPNSNSPHHHPPSSLSGIDQADHISLTNRQNNASGHISFTDELFINHSFQQNNQVVSPSKVQAHIHHLNQDKFPPPSHHIVKTKNGQRKNNFETFLMTGDAIIQVTKDSNDLFKASPTKTTSKLMPMPHMPVFVERDKDYNRRLMMMEKEKEKSESDVSPPLPPPPPTVVIEESSKSDHLPPPPPPEEEHSLKNGHSKEMNGAGGGAVNGHGGQKDRDRCPEHPNEDTSISSSVMSDSGSEILDGGDEDIKKMTDPLLKDSPKLKLGPGRKSISMDSYDAARESSDGEGCLAVVTSSGGRDREKERYNEYILLNGSRGTLNEEDLSGSGGIQNESKDGYNSYSSQHAMNRDKTASTITGGNDSDEQDDSISENDLVGASYDKLGHQFNNNESYSGDSDSSDVESMRVAPVTKAVDIPSAERLAKRLFQLDGFKVTDVWRHLSKNTDFNRVVATEYLNFFTFKEETLDVSLRKFLLVCPLRGETQDRERVLSYFSARYVECNPDTFGSQDSVHTLACAIMLLNTDMYSGIRNQRMTCSEFIENLQGLNDGGDFPRDVLKQLYLSIRAQPLVSPADDTEDEDSTKGILPMDPPVASSTIEFKRGYLVRKCTHEFGGRKTPLGKRSWKMFFCRLKELLLVISPDETSKTLNDFQIKIHHAFASIATDYRKKRNVFRLILADKSQFLFQSSDTREMHSWIDMINWNAARFSSPALEAPVSSSGKFERPLLPSCVTRMSRREQGNTHQDAMAHWEREMDALTRPKKKGSSNLKKEDKEKLMFYQYEIRRYRTYLEILEKRANSENNDRSEELVELQVLPNPPVLMEEQDS